MKWALLFWTYVNSVILAYSELGADPGPGDIFREYPWTTNPIGWQRVTEPAVTRAEAKVFLPNPVNTVELDDLAGAVRAEISLEQWGGHAGTSNKRLRVNGGPWIPVPEPVGIPADAGKHRWPECYQYFAYPSVALPLDALREGENTFEFTCNGQICFSFGWGQWGVYGVTFRVYYDDAKPHPTGRITAPAQGHTIGDGPLLEAEASSSHSAIERVDFIGHYEDFDFEGNGIYRQWHYNYHFSEIRQHLGTAFEAPFSVTWDTEWVPDQTSPIQVMARIKDAEGMYYMTPTVGDIVLERTGRSVKLYKPYNVPPRWQTRDLTSPQMATVYVGHNLQKATDARLVGYGEAHAPVAPRVAHTVVIDLLAPLLLGRDARQIQVLWEQMFSAMRLRSHTEVFTAEAIAGLDIALWDLLGHYRQEPVWLLLGGAFRRQLPVYSSGIPGTTTAEQVKMLKKYSPAVLTPPNAAATAATCRNKWTSSAPYPRPWAKTASCWLTPTAPLT